MSDPPRDSSGSNPVGPWVRPVVLGAACLVLGFVGGWVLHPGGGSSDTLPEVSEEYLRVATTPPAGQTVSESTGTGTGTAPGTDTTAVPAPDRSQVNVAVLNGTSTTGHAATKAEQLRALRYVNVSTGNAPTASGDSVVYYRGDERTAAEQTAGDLGIQQVLPLPASGPITSAAASLAQARVIVVLRSA